MSLERWKCAEAELVPSSEGSMCIVDTRDGVAPPGSKTASRMNSMHRNMRGPTGSAGVVSSGGRAQGIAVARA